MMSRAWIEDLGDDGLAFVHRVSGSDIDAVIQYAHEKGSGKLSDDMRHAMTVPEAVIIDWCNRHGVTFQRLMTDNSITTKFLNDPDNGCFRPWKGRI